MGSKAFGWLVGLIVVTSILILAGISNGWFGMGRQGRVAVRPEAESKVDNQTTVDLNTPPGPGYVKVGGVWRPKSDVELTVPGAAVPNADPAKKPSPVGRTPGIEKDANPAAKSIAEAIKNPELAYRLSNMLPAPEFDRAKYEADKQAYLDEVVPGRIWQSATDESKAAKIKRVGEYGHQVLQGETVVLTAEAEPGMPVTFYSPRMGQFENLFPTITVAANEKGIATAHFKAAGGTRGEIDIIASSPVRTGLARYLVEVILPGEDAAPNPTSNTKSENGGG